MKEMEKEAGGGRARRRRKISALGEKEEEAGGSGSGKKRRGRREIRTVEGFTGSEMNGRMMGADEPGRNRRRK